jgi:hypothetical protein
VNTGFRIGGIVRLLDTVTFRRLSSLQFDIGYDTMKSPIALSEDRVAFIASGEQGRGVFLTNALATSLPLGRVEPTSSTPASIEVPIAARALVMDATRGVLYAAVGREAPAYENRVVVIEPNTGRIVESFDVGSNPMSLALSGAGSILWVGLEDAGAVRRVDLSCVRESITGAAFTLPYQAAPAQVIPMIGRPESFAAQLGSLNSTAFYEDGVLRTDFGEQAPGASAMVAGPAGVLFAYQDTISDFRFFTVAYDGDGVTTVAHDSVLSGYGKALAYDPDGFVYTSDGDVVDVHDPSQPSYVGHFDLPVGDKSKMLPLPGPLAIWVNGNQLRQLDSSTLALGPTRTTGCPTAVEVFDLVHVAPGRIAFVGLKTEFSPGSGSVCIVTDPDLIP